MVAGVLCGAAAASAQHGEVQERAGRRGRWAKELRNEQVPRALAPGRGFFGGITRNGEFESVEGKNWA